MWRVGDGALWGHELERHLRSLGLQACALDGPPEPWMRQRWLSRDLIALGVQGQPYERVALRHGGRLPLHPDNWSSTTAIGMLPIRSRAVQPVQYHFVLLDVDATPARRFEAELGIPRSFFGGRRFRARWWGGALARRLDGDDGLADDLGAQLKSHERLAVKVQPEDRCLRVILQSRAVLHFAVLPRVELEADQGLPDERVLALVARIARHARDELES